MPSVSDDQNSQPKTRADSATGARDEEMLADALVAKFPGAAIIHYGSGASVMRDAKRDDVLHDFYVIAPSYRDAFSSPLLRLANWVLPPNVFYIEAGAGGRVARAKYAVLSIAHFEKLVSEDTFHSYFWARFAQPSRIIRGSADLHQRIEAATAAAIDTFVKRSAPLAPPDASARTIWKEGLERSYRAELRAEQPGRVDALLDSYGDWPEQVTRPDARKASLEHRARAARAWKLRIVQGGFLSVLRLAKATATFQGGADYIVWKIRRHSGIEVPVKEWERRHPLLASPLLAFRYYRLRAQKKDD